MDLKYKKVLLKVSGEALAGEKGYGFDFDTMHEVCANIKKIVDMGAQVAIVVGGGNIWRGRSGGDMDRTRADHIGMLATVMNSLALADSLEQMGVIVRVQTAIEMNKIAEPYIQRRAIRHLEKGRVVIFGAGTGSPFFSTDTTAALRASEIKAEVILMAKNGVDGVYSADPDLDPTAVKYDSLTYMDIIEQGLKVMDHTAVTMCMDNNIDLLVFNMNEMSNIKRAVLGEKIGTVVSKEAK